MNLPLSPLAEACKNGHEGYRVFKYTIFSFPVFFIRNLLTADLLVTGILHYFAFRLYLMESSFCWFYALCGWCLTESLFVCYKLHAAHTLKSSALVMFTLYAALSCSILLSLILHWLTRHRFLLQQDITLHYITLHFDITWSFTLRNPLSAVFTFHFFVLCEILHLLFWHFMWLKPWGVLLLLLLLRMWFYPVV